jgi:hypothetical protein
MRFAIALASGDGDAVTAICARGKSMDYGYRLLVAG